MEEDWYTIEQQIRDRHTELWAAARIRSLTRELAPKARRTNSIGVLISRLANRVLACAMRLPQELSRVIKPLTLSGPDSRTDSSKSRRRQHLTLHLEE